MLIFCQFSDPTETLIIAIFGMAQDPEVYPNQGVVEDTDQRYLDFLNPPPPIPTIPEAKESKRKEMREACSNEIERTSFSSSALGAVHNYDCRLVDQINLKMRYDIASSQVAEEPVWASDGTRYEWKDHSAQELLEVMMDMNDSIKAKQEKLVTKMAAVDASTTLSQIAAVSWD